MSRLSAVLALVAGCLFSSLTLATEYPVTLTDLAGREVTLPAEPERIILQDGRDLMSLAVLDRESPFARVVAWNNLVARNDEKLWQQMLEKWPQARDIMDMKFGDGGEMNLETVLAKEPDLVLIQLRSKPALEQAGVLDMLAKVNVPVLFVDLAEDPVAGATESMALMGKALNRESEAKAFNDFVAEHLEGVKTRVAKALADGREPASVFVEAHAGVGGNNDCCFTHADFGWGALIAAAGGHNVGLDLLDGDTATIAMEKVLAMEPDIYVMTGSQWSRANSIALPFGYDIDPANIQAAFEGLLARPGFSELRAAKEGQVYGLYHQFYNHPYNVIAIEALAKDFYPQAFADLDPMQSYRDLMAMTELSADGITLFAKVDH
ncbi:ABC transporter substrate-binding protein [Marinobacterium lutimaris]|uniref:Iron complex transport system substrate-binding protein n=1 Tax=Marinobacterium lutimaris TaxID=568106 RepID=A0A1H5Z167_9GAMM|nr:ABC transporter substrate-binding protein [Marinobacterium lutimaris]SEG30339.1 iron complex transport system substrate-binding protein [Marinobacterium lutimaris]